METVPAPQYAAFAEQVGVSTKEVRAFLDDVLQTGIELHSLIVYRHGKIAAETYREPYAADIAHTMYSVSKAVTSAAVGFAIAEGLLSLDTKVIDIFEEHRPKKPDELLERLTIWHLLTMTAGKDVSVLSDKTKGNWVGQYFAARWEFAPGEGYKYISENTYMLCAILHRLTGQSVRDYLRPRLFAPLGIDRDIFWETDENGIEAGGWGLFLTTQELLRFCMLYLDGGKYMGKQVLPVGWAEESGKAQADTSGRETSLDALDGYGYCFWRNSLPNSFRADGMFSQFGMVFADYDALLIMTASEIDEQKARDCIWRHFPQMCIDPMAAPPQDAVTDLSLPALPNLAEKPHSKLERELEGKTIRFRKLKLVNLIGFPVSVLPLSVVYMSANKAGNINNVQLRFLGNACEMTWDEGPEHNTIRCGMDGKLRKSPMRLGDIDFTAGATAAWEDENTLHIWVRALESICERRLTFRFEGKKVTMKPTNCPDTQSTLSHLASGLGTLFPNPVILRALQWFLNTCYGILEPKHRGKLR